MVVELLLKATSTYSELNDNEKAIELYNYVIAIRQRTLSLEHESLVVPLNIMVYLILEERRFKELKLIMFKFCNTIPLFYNFFVICLSL
jgi:hypothetical protein